MLRCSFCGKSEKQVGRLVRGPSSAICQECVDIAAQSFKGEQADRTSMPVSAVDVGQSAISAYLRQHEGAWPPTREERERLLLQARTGNDEAFRALVRGCLSLTALTAAAFAPASLPLMDAIVEGNAVLVALVRDPAVSDPLLHLAAAVSAGLDQGTSATNDRSSGSASRSVGTASSRRE